MMFDSFLPRPEELTPEEQVLVARCVAVLAESDAQRGFLEELMGRMMLLPEERDAVRTELGSGNVARIRGIGEAVKHREGRLCLYSVAAVCGALGESGAVEMLAELGVALEFDQELAVRFVCWMAEGLAVADRGQQIVAEMF